jgi:integrase
MCRMPASSRRRRRPEGVVTRHSRRCASRAGTACICRPAYQAQAWSSRDGRTIRKTFATLADARAWRAEAQSALRRGVLRAPTRTTLAQAAEDWLTAAQAGIVRTRSGETYKPSALRSYEQALRLKVLPELGHLRLSALTRNAVQDLADRLLAQGLSPSSVRNAILPLRAIYRHENPVRGPMRRGPRARF